MSSFAVHPTDVVSSGSRLTHIAGEVTAMQDSVVGTSGAASGTSLQDAFEDLLGHWGAVLPHFALSGAGLSTVLQTSGNAYTAADRAVGSAADQGYVAEQIG